MLLEWFDHVERMEQVRFIERVYKSGVDERWCKEHERYVGRAMRVYVP